jgi:hypothetical protein
MVGRSRPGFLAVLRPLALLAAVSLVAAACSSGVSTGDIGTTLPAMNGIIKLDSVISPAYVGPYSPGQPTPGRKLVAVILTVHNPAAANTRFGGIYADSKLVDSRNHSHSAHSSSKFQVTECTGYPDFGVLGPQQSVTGCEVYEISNTVTPAQLKISGHLKAAWNIAASAVQVGAVAPVAPGPAEVGGTPSSQASTATTTTAPAEESSTSTSTSMPGVGPVRTTAKHRQVTRAPVITRVYPPSASVGQPVTIVGRRLQGAKSVTFDGVPGVITFMNKREVVAVIPAGASSGPIVVVTSSGTVASPRSLQVS